MSASNRLRNYAIGLGTGLLLAFLVAYPLWDTASELDETILSQAYEATQEAERGKIAVSEECAAILTPEEKQECIYEKSQPYREAERNERDLEAQQVMGNWTRVMGKAAIIGIFVGIVGLFLIFTTFWETRKAASASLKTYEAFVAAEDASLQVRLHSGTIIEHTIEGVRQPDTYSMRIYVDNIGRSTAKIDGWEVEGKFLRQDYILKAGETYRPDRHLFLLAEDNIVKISLFYSTPIRERLVLDIVAKLRAKRNSSGVDVYSGRIQSARLRTT